VRSHFLSAASALSARSASAVASGRAAVGRAGLAARAAVRVARRRARRNLGVAVVAAVVVGGLIAGLVAALVPSGPAAPQAAASDTGTARTVASQGADHAAGAPAARSAVSIQAGKTAAASQPAKKAAKATGLDRPYVMYDSVTPAKIPGSNHWVATYATGHYRVPPSQVPNHGVTWIDTNGTDPKNSSVLDVEPGNVSPAFAAIWVKARLTAHPTYTARVYTMRSQWGATKAAVATLPAWMQSHVKWWIADPTGVQHVVPGSDATQWYWGRNYDISTVNPGF
jgi:hypothetical protein